MSAKPTNRRRALADTVALLEGEETKLRRKSDTLAGIVKRVELVEEWAIDHQQNHDGDVQGVLENFMASDNFIPIAKKLWQHEEIRAAIVTAKNQMVGEIVSAIFNNRMLWLFAVIVILLLMGYDLQFIKDLLKTIIL
jgi:hypothetical protein